MFEEKDFNPTPISTLGEFALIQRLVSNFDIKRKETVTGAGDDCAVLDLGGTEFTLIAADILTEGIHYDLRYVPLKHLGYKCVAVNVSDIYAMNGTPLAITVSIAISSRFSVEGMDELYAGIKIACEEFNIDLIGGDTSSTISSSFINVSIVGTVSRDKIIYRKGAAEHDLICVSGDLGGAYAGLQVLERELKVFQSNAEIQPELSNYDYVVGRQLKPSPRGVILEALASNGIKPTSMIDVSDGLASDLLHLCGHSDLGSRIFQDKIPVDHQTSDVADEFKIAPLTFALNGGEDYELLFTVKPGDFNKLSGIPEVSIIGHMTASGTGSAIHLTGGEEVPLTAQGWNHFR
jgi:thiamine-monophosphate kinase